MRKGHVATLNRLYLSTVETLATAIDAKDEVTHGHIRRVQTGTVALARALNVTDDLTLQALEAASLLHDTGKIAVPEHILNKPGKLTPAEFEKMKLHAPIGAEILSSIDFPYPVVPIVRHHHENWDGTGYPDGLRGTEIPLGARILSVVDCFDALTSDRPYRRRLSDEEALKIVTDRRGTMYDPHIVDKFVASYKEIMPPTDETAHPVARALGGARDAVRQPVAATEATVAETPVSDEVLAVTSLSRAVAGDASLTDVGALAWMMIRNVVPCTSMALFVNDEGQDAVAVRFAAGAHAPVLRRVRKQRGAGISGWASATRRGVLNADASLDLGPDAAAMTPPLRSALAVPLSHEGSCVGVLTLYAATANAFSEDQLRLLELLAPSFGASVATVNAAEPGGDAAGDAARLRRAAAVEARLADHARGSRRAGDDRSDLATGLFEVLLGDIRDQSIDPGRIDKRDDAPAKTGSGEPRAVAAWNRRRRGQPTRPVLVSRPRTSPAGSRATPPSSDQPQRDLRPPVRH